jgi:hypothetical protein
MRNVPKYAAFCTSRGITKKREKVMASGAAALGGSFKGAAK